MTPINTIPFSGLNPERILDALESVGYRCDGGLMALNSYENRVWQVSVMPASRGPYSGKKNGANIY